jgi:hypothetical protein
LLGVANKSRTELKVLNLPKGQKMTSKVRKRQTNEGASGD